MAARLTHAISGIDIALWDILGKATGQPVGRLLGGRYRDRVQPYCSLLMDEPEAMHRDVSQFRAWGFRAFKIGWGPFGRRGDAGLDEAIVVAARDAAGVESALMVDAGGSDAFWPNRLKWAMAHRADAGTPRRRLVRGTARTRCARRLCPAAPGKPGRRSPAAKC